MEHIADGARTDGLSDLELLTIALAEAEAARDQGLIIGVVDEVALRRALRRATHRDAARNAGFASDGAA